jgi:hypothetical protein
MAIINGRRIDPTSIGAGVRGSELAREARAGFGRRPIIEKGGKVETIDPTRTYYRGDLIDKRGRGAKITSMPERMKGYGRSAESNRLISEQVLEVAQQLFKQGVQFDEDGADWLVIPDYPLPDNWHHIARSTALLVVFPKEYPMLPPVGFYLPNDVPCSPDGHLFGFAAHGASDAPIRAGWRWFCIYTAPGAWRPQRNWRHGDNLFTYFTLIREALGSNH